MLVKLTFGAILHGSVMDTAKNLNTDLAQPDSPPATYPNSVAFIHDFLDAYGLDPYEFRVYSHIVRRTGGKPEKACFASLATISAICKISERKIQQVLKFLVKAGMITKEKNLGRKTDVYRVTHSSKWASKSQLDELRRSKQSKRNDAEQINPFSESTSSTGADEEEQE
jgi:predicted transcriptional regulator